MLKVSAIWVASLQIMQDVQVKLNPGLPWQKKCSTTRRRIFSPAKWA
jgi:hypothetical protein